MGVVGGAFLPSEALPAADTTDFNYVMDRKHYLRQLQGRREAMLAALGGDAAPAEDHSAHQH
jgi:hypothetical protein